MFPMQGAQVQSLVRECIPHAATKSPHTAIKSPHVATNNWHSQIKKKKKTKQTEVEHSLTPHTKINLKWSTVLNVKLDTINVLKENIGRTLT